MFRSLGSVICVVVMAAFVFGCGGGGGTTPTDPPDVVDPVLTDAERIAEAQQMVANILTSARARAAAASSAASALGANPDATAAQITSAASHSADAQSALARIVSANTAAIAAATPAAAQTALTNAQTARNTLSTAADAIVSIQSAVQAVTNARNQREMDERALTNNSSLIQHLRDNKLLSDTVRDALTIDSIVVGGAGNSGPSSGNPRVVCAEPCAEFPTDIGTGADRVTGQRTVRMRGLISSSTTPTLTGTSTLSHGFDLKNATNTTFVNAYTDISRERRSRNSAVNTDDPATLHDERYNYNPDTDYLLAGIWLTVGATDLSTSRIMAFAYGGQPTSSATPNFCSGNEGSGESGTGTTSVTNRVCGPTAGFNTISTFVKDGQDFTATYRGKANGAYLAGGDSSYFTGDVTLTAEFENPTGTATGTGSIEGEVTNIVAGGQSMAGSLELQEQSLGDDISGDDKFAAGSTVGVVDGKSFDGSWKGQFFGMTRVTRSQTSVPVRDTSDPVVTTTTITTTYSPQAPGSVAGTFYATQQSNPAGEAAFIGAFGAHR